MYKTNHPGQNRRSPAKISTRISDSGHRSATASILGVKMNKIQNQKNRDLEKPTPGCLGRMVNLFELNTSMGGNKFLTDKPHRDGSPLSRSQSDVSRTVVDGQMDDKVIVSGLKNSPSYRKSNVTPIKMLIAKEMSKEDDSKQTPPNLVAKLMGLDPLPEQCQPGSASHRSHLRGSRSHLGSLEHAPEQRKNKNVYETRQQSGKTDYVRDDSPQNRRYIECKNDPKTAPVHEKFMEAKCLSAGDKHCQSKQFQDALEVLCSNKDLFLKILQKPNSLFSQHLYNLQSFPLPTDSKQITVLKSSNSVDCHRITGSGKKRDKQVKGALPMGRLNGCDKSSSEFLQSAECRKLDDKPTQPTRILVLKPSFEKPHGSKAFASPPSSSLRTLNDDGYYGDSEDNKASESIKMAEEITHEGVPYVLSNGYVGDGSPFSKSKIDYASGDLSDSDVMSPTSRHSWEYINRFDSSSSVPSASYSPDLSVCKEAKKRLSEKFKWKCSGKVQEQRHLRRSSSTLAEMLALSDLKDSMKSKEEYKNKEEPRESTSCLTSGFHKAENVDNSPKNLLRSDYVPISSTSSGSGLSIEIPNSLKSETDDTKDAKKEGSIKSSSIKGRVSSLFFSKNKKSIKENSHQCRDESQSAGLPVHSTRNVGDDGSQCLSNAVAKEEPCIGLHTSLRKASCQGSSTAGLKQGRNLPETEFSIAKPETCGLRNENPDHPSPISVLEPQFEDDDHTTNFASAAKLSEQGVEPIKCNLIYKSPPIGSFVRTLSWDESAVGPAMPSPVKSSTPPVSPDQQEHEYFFYVKTLLSSTRLNAETWHSPESPLDPSLRDKYMDTSEKETRDAKLRRRRISIRKLVFDCVNEALMDATRHGPHGKVEDMALSSTELEDHVWTRMKEWVSGDERYVLGSDGGSGAVEERMVRKEVRRGWAENLRLEFDDLRNEIEGKLLEELLQESVLEFT